MLGGLTVRQFRFLLAGLLVGLLLSSLDNTIVSTAMPTIVGKLGGFSKFTWVTTAYVVTSTISTLLLGKLSDLHGRQRLLTFSVAAFLVGSLACGAAQTMNQLIVFRAVQGIGGGGIWGLTFAIVGSLVAPVDRGKYFGLFTSVFATSSIIGPLAGGFIVDHFNWRWIFYVNLPLGLVALFIVAFGLRIPDNPRGGRFDWKGAALLSLAITCLMVALEEGGHRGWGSNVVVGLFVATVVLSGLFVSQERRVAEAVLPLHLFRDPVMRNTLILAVFIGTGMMTVGLFMSLFFQDVSFVSPTGSGLRLIPMVLGMTSAATVTGRLISRTGRYRAFPIVGTSIGILALTLATRLTVDRPYWYIAAFLFMFGVGLGLTMPVLTIATQNAAAPGDIGVVTAASNFFRSLGSSLGLALYGAVFNVYLRQQLRERLPGRGSGAELAAIVREPRRIKALEPDVRDAVTASITTSITRVFMVGIGLLGVGFVAAWFVREKPLRATASAPGSVPALAEA